MALYDLHKNFAASTVATAPSPATSGLSLTVASGEGARFPTPPFNLVAFPTTATYATMAAVAEIVRVTAIAGDVLTIPAGGRAQEGTTAKSIAVGWNVGGAVTLKAYSDIELIGESAGPAYPSGQFYGTSFMAGSGAPASKYGMPQGIMKELGVSFEGAATPGAQVVAPGPVYGGPAAMLQNPDFEPDLRTGPYLTPGGLKMAMIGFNDEPGLNPLTQGEEQTENALALTWSIMLGARRIKPVARGAAGIGVALNSAECTYTGATWAAFANTTLSDGLGYAWTTTVNDLVNIPLGTFYNGEAICVLFPLIANLGRFTAQVRLNPAGANTLLATQDFTQWQVNTTAIGFGADPLGSIQCIRIPAGVIPAGSAQTIQVKITAITAANAGVFGGLIIEGNAPLFVPTAPVFPTSASLTARSAWDVARQVATAVNFPTAVLVSLTPALAPQAAGYTTNAPGDALADADLAAWWSATVTGHPSIKGYARMSTLMAEAAKKVTLSKLNEMSAYQADTRALAKWMKPTSAGGVGWVLSTNRGVCENYDRQDAATTLALVTAKLYGIGGFTIPAGKWVSGVDLLATVAGTTFTARWVGLCRLSDRVCIASSLNAATPYTVGETAQWFTKPWQAQVDTDVYAIFGVVFSAGTPTLQAKAANVTQQARVPILAGVSTAAATTTPPTAEVLVDTGLTAVPGTVIQPFTSLTLATLPHVTLLG